MNYDFFLYLLKAGLVLAILTVAYAWLVKRETFLQVNRWLLWINVAATLSLPIIPMPDFEWMPDAPAKVVAEVIPSRQALPDSKPSKKYEELAVAPLPNSKSLENQDAVPISSALTFWDWMGMVYVLVVGLLTLKLAIQLGTLWRLKRNGVNYEPEDGVHLVESEKITAPFSFFHWVFYNPTHHNDDEWAQIWAHECIHVHQRHSIDMLTAEAMKIVFWFNPFAWWHQRLVQETLEFITDRAVLASGVEKKSYQYHLLRSTLSADKQTFTNHFNQSLLKNRIAMMNRTKSKWMGLGKYGLFIGMLWLCAAFTKPYRAEVAAKIVEKVPELKLALRPKAAEKAVFNDFVWKKPLSKSQKDTTQLALEAPTATEADTQKLVSATKYVIYEEQTLHWVITPKTTLEDLFAMKQEFKKHNLELEIREMKMDPMQSFLQRISVTSERSNGGSCSWDEGDNILKPIASHGGYITIVRGGCGTTDKENMHPTLKTVSQQDEKTANEDFYKNRIEYLIVETDSKTGAGGSTNMRRKSLEYYKEKGKKSGLLNLNENDFLQVAEPHRNDIILHNGKPSTLEEVEKISLKDFHSAIFKETWSEGKLLRQHYILIFTEN
jgi:beta-lactamase regulating signal transducer with metallopeptidase domain